MKRFLVGLLLASSLPALGATRDVREENPDLGFLFIGGKQAFVLSPLPGLPVQERAMQIRNILMGMVQKSGTVQPFNPSDLTVKAKNGVTLSLRGTPLATVTDADARKLRLPPSVLAARWADNLRAGLSILKVGAQVPYQFILLKDRQGKAIPLGQDSLSTEVLAALAMARDLQRVKVTGQDGIVVLSGTVPTLASREQAEALASQVARLREIRNWIEIDPPLIPDDPLLQAVKRRLSLHVLTREANLQVAVSGGIVALEGVAPTLLVKELAEELAGHVPGVARVENRIAVRPDYPRDDEDIRKDLVSRLEGNGTIRRNASFDVTVLQGVVTLGGIADSLMVRNAALDEACRISGVVDVVDRIEVSPP